MLIRIDRSTLRRNPRAGETQSTFDSGLVDTTIDWNIDGGTYNLARNGDAFVVVGAHSPNGIAYHPGDTIAIDDLKNGELIVETNRDIQTVSHLPLPEWLYEYEPADVTCTNCGATFDHSRLTSDTCFDGDSEHCSFTVCPECGEWECCDVEYERPEDVDT